MATPHSPLTLVIRTRSDTIFNGEVAAVSSINPAGPFDILPEHASFISLINNIVIVHGKDGVKRQMKISEGIMHVDENTVHIYLENSENNSPLT